MADVARTSSAASARRLLRDLDSLARRARNLRARTWLLLVLTGGTVLVGTHVDGRLTNLHIALDGCAAPPDPVRAACAQQAKLPGAHATAGVPTRTISITGRSPSAWAAGDRKLYWIAAVVAILGVIYLLRCRGGPLTAARTTASYYATAAGSAVAVQLDVAQAHAAANVAGLLALASALAVIGMIEGSWTPLAAAALLLASCINLGHPPYGLAALAVPAWRQICCGVVILLLGVALRLRCSYRLALKTSDLPTPPKSGPSEDDNS